PGLPADLHDLGSREQGALGTGRPRAEPAPAPAARRMARRLRSPADAGAPGRGGGDRARLLRERAPPSGRSPPRRRELGDGVTPFPDEVFDLASVVFEVAHADPERIAVIEPAGRGRDGRRRYRRYGYRQLSAAVESVAPGLRELGIAERTRTVFMAPPSYGASVAALALARVGATTVWIDPSVGYRNVAERLGRLAPEAFVGIPITLLARLVFGWGPRAPRQPVTA